MNRVLLWQWGRRGGGPKYTLELARAMAQRDDIAISLSLSPQAEIYADAVALGLPIFPVTTYRDARSAITGLFRLPMVRRLFCEYLVQNRIDTVAATMSHIWNPLIVDVVKRSGAKLITVIHDAVAHPGDEYPFRRRMLARELAYSDQVVTLSRHVADQVVRYYGYPDQLISVIPHGVFRFGPVRRRTPPIGRPFKYLFSGDCLPTKGSTCCSMRWILSTARFRSNSSLSVPANWARSKHGSLPTPGFGLTAGGFLKPRSLKCSKPRMRSSPRTPKQVNLGCSQPPTAPEFR